MALIGLLYPLQGQQLILVYQIKIKEHGYNTPLMAKIEKWEAVKNLDSIVQAFDGVMVARGLGVTPSEQVPVIQKNIIKKAKLYGKPVVIATQMLDSMIENHSYPR